MWSAVWGHLNYHAVPGASRRCQRSGGRWQLAGGASAPQVAALRSFSRYLRRHGEISLDLAACVPTVPNWSRSTLPKFLPPGTVQRVLSRCDRQAPLGRRNYAILRLLAKLGLRAGQVVALNLEDIDWDASQVTVHGKGRRSIQMPLPADVGEAIAAYLRLLHPPGFHSRQGSVRRVCLAAADCTLGLPSVQYPSGIFLLVLSR